MEKAGYDVIPNIFRIIWKSYFDNCLFAEVNLMTGIMNKPTIIPPTNQAVTYPDLLTIDENRIGIQKAPKSERPLTNPTARV